MEGMSGKTSEVYRARTAENFRSLRFFDAARTTPFHFHFPCHLVTAPSKQTIRIQHQLNKIEFNIIERDGRISTHI